MVVLTDFHYEPDKKEENGNELLEKIDILAKKLNIKDELSLCNLYAYLLYTGKLSINKTFYYDKENVKDNDFYNIMLGYGCCRNIAKGLKEVLDKADIKNCILSTAPLYKIDSNHVVNLIITDKGYFVYDITNMFFFKVSGKLLKTINEKTIPIKVTDIYTTFCGSRKSGIDIYNHKYIKDFDACPLLKKVRKNPRYTKEEYLQHYEKDIAYFKENEDLFTKFYDDAFDNIKEITNSI